MAIANTLDLTVHVNVIKHQCFICGAEYSEIIYPDWTYALTDNSGESSRYCPKYSEIYLCPEHSSYYESYRVFMDGARSEWIRIHDNPEAIEMNKKIQREKLRKELKEKSDEIMKQLENLE